MAANFFDQFDPATAKPEGGGKGGNFFDQFDPGTAKPEPKRSLGGIVRDIGVTALKGAVGLPQAAVGLLDIPTGGHAGKAIEGAGVRFKDAQDALDSMYSPAQQGANRKVREADGFIGTAKAMLENPSTIATGIGESLPQMLGGAGVARGLMAAAPRLGAVAAGAIGEGVIGAGSAAEQVRQQTADGLLTGKQAALAGASGLATAGLGALGGKVAQRLGVGDVDTMLAGGTARAAGKGSTRSTARQVLEGAVAEGALEEMPQSIAEQALQNVALERPWDQGVGAAAAQGLITGAAMGGVGGGVGASANRAHQRAEAQALQADPTRAWNTEAGAADPNQPAMERTAPPEAPELQTSPGAAGPREGMDFTREVDTSGLALEDPAEVARARAATMDYQPGDTTPQWDTARGVAQDRQPGLDMPAPEFDTGSLGLESRSRSLSPSQQIGIDPGAGPLSKVAAAAVDAGGAQEAQFLGATGRDLQVRRAGPGVADESNVIDVQGRVVEDRAIGTPRRIEAARRLGGAEAEALSTGANQPQSILNAPANGGAMNQVVALMHKAQTATDSVASIPQFSPNGAPNGSQADQAQQAAAQPTQAGAAPHDGSQRSALENSAGAAGKVGLGVAGAVAPDAVASRPDGWRKSMLKAGPAAKAMGIDPKGKRLAQVVAEIDAADAQRAGVRQDGADLAAGQIDREWSAFAPETGTLGVPRAVMPQIKAEHRGALVNFLKARGIDSRAGEVPANDLKPTQAEFSPGKVEKARAFQGGDRSILVSSDGYVVDGHHQWLAKRANGEPVKVIRLQAPIRQVLAQTAEFPSTASARGAQTTQGTPDAATPRNLRLADERAPGAAAPTSDRPGQQDAGAAPAVGAGQRAGGDTAQPAPAVRADVPDAGGAGQPAAGVAPQGREVSREIGKHKEGLSEFRANQVRAELARKNPQVVYTVEQDDTLKNGFVVVGRRPVPGAKLGVSTTTASSTAFATELVAAGPDASSVVGVSTPSQWGGQQQDRAARPGLRQESAENQVPALDQQAPVATKSGAKSAATGPRTARAAAPQPTTRIDDFGETLHGARKMLYAEAYADGMAKAKDLDTKAHPLSKTWPEPDYQKLLDGGSPLEAVSIARALRDAVPTKPQTTWKLKGWAAKVEALRGFAEDVLSGRLDTKTVEGSMERSGMRGVPNKAALYEAVGHERSLKGLDLSAGHYSMYNGVRYDPARTIWTVEREAKGSTFGNWPRELAKGDTREAAIAAFKKRAAELLAEEQAPTKGATFEIYSKRAGGAREFFIGKKIGRNVAELKAGFADLKAARQYKADHQSELEDLLAKHKAVPPVRNTQNAPRIGEDYRNGADVTPERFQDAFGFRGVQFGNYVEGARRQQDLNRAFDALMDLAGVLGLPPRALSLGGRLGLAFGARGTGGTDAAAAHYERGNVVINLTKREGAGSLAHEWWHALDNYFSRQRGDGGSYLTEDSRRGDGVREEMRAAFRAVMSAINLTGMQERSRKLDDRRTKEYWTTKPEMSARAFESYVIAKLQDQNAGNDYLANVVGDAVFALEGAYPYPTAGELPQIRAAFDAFFQTVETRQGDAGETVLFSREADQPMSQELARALLAIRRPATKESVRAAVRELVNGMGVLPNRLGRVVVATAAEIQQDWEPLIGPIQLHSEGQGQQDGAGKAQGFYDPNSRTVFLIADHIRQGDELGVVAHELMHKHGPAVLGEEGWSRLHGAIEDWASAPEGSQERQVYDEAAARVRQSRPEDAAEQDYSSQELFPYAVQVALEQGVRPNLLAKPGTVARWLGQVKAALREVWSKIVGKPESFNSQDLVNLAFGIAQRENPEHAGQIDGAISSMEQEIRDVIDAARQPGGHAPQKAVLGGVTAWLVREARLKAGVDLEGFAHVLDGSAVRHIIKNHFDEKTERLRGQLPVTEADLYALPSVAASPERVVLGTKNRLGREQIAYVKRMPDGSLLYLEEIRTGRAELAAVSVRKYPATMNVDTIVSTLHPNAQGDGGNGLIVLTPPEAGKPQFSRVAAPTAGDYTPEQQRAAEHVFGVQHKQTLAERVQAFRANLGTRLRQGLVDQFAPIKEVSPHAYMLARMSKGSDAAVEAALLYGKPFLRDGVADVNIQDGGFAQALASLKGEHDRFFQWVAAQRAERLKAEGKENLLTDQDITALRSLNAGKMADGTVRMPVYAAALRELNAFNEASLKVALESGLIDQAAYDLMKDQPYVPFYRLMEEGDMRGPRFSSGLVNQQAWKKLKGGKEQINADLLQNTLMNWSHLYAAAARNRASLATMAEAEKLGIAYQVPADTKGAVKVMRDGMAEHWAVEDPYLLEAISALNYTPGGIVKALAPFKRLLTFGVTVNPTFKIRNLIRDSLSAIAQSDLSYNPLENVAKGWKATRKDSQTYASMLASGGIIKFGTQEDTSRLRGQIERLGGTMLDQQGWDKLKGQMRSLWEAYEEFGDRTENVNRTALYERLIAKGHSHAEASFMARDLMDFSMSGKWETVRFLAQTVPFLNARLQGLYKLGRAAKEDPRRFAAMAGAVSLASLGLLAAYGDDDDWKKREDWDRDNFWWFKVGGMAFRIPKPFEVGAIGTVAERTAELMMSEEMTGKRFGQRISDMVFNTFAMDPTPQAIKPFLDVYANKDSFSGRAIEGMADERLRPQDRYNERTSEVARLLGSWGLPDPVRLAKGEYSGLSPKQVDFLLRGYFGWLATVATTVTDAAARPMLDRGERPAMRLRDTFLAGNFVESLPTGSSRYVSTMYEQARDVEQAWASYQAAMKSGDMEKAREIQQDEAPKLRNRMAVENAKRQIAELGQQAKRIESNRLIPAEEKRRRLDELEARKHDAARRVAPTS